MPPSPQMVRAGAALSALGLVMLAAFAGCSDDRRFGDGDNDGGAGGSSTGPGPGPGSGSSSSGGSGGPAQLCVDLINQYRASIGLAPYARWTAAEACADGEAQSDGETGQAHGAFPACDESAQNECPGWPGPPEEMIGGCLQMMWDEGPGGGHYDTMSSTSYTEVACGFHTFPDGSVWAVQDFR